MMDAEKYGGGIRDERDWADAGCLAPMKAEATIDAAANAMRYA
ncbi:hypothetical protein [Xanthomonas bromi]|nr:hypothetical protein [Xanthomonas bromi]